jgi:hypothetical protein
VEQYAHGQRSIAGTIEKLLTFRQSLKLPVWGWNLSLSCGMGRSGHIAKYTLLQKLWSPMVTRSRLLWLGSRSRALSTKRLHDPHSRVRLVLLTSRRCRISA